jgi:hypothetical protein
MSPTSKGLIVDKFCVARKPVDLNCDNIAGILTAAGLAQGRRPVRLKEPKLYAAYIITVP